MATQTSAVAGSGANQDRYLLIMILDFSLRLIRSSRRYSTSHATTRPMHQQSSRPTPKASSFGTGGQVPNRQLGLYLGAQARAAPPLFNFNTLLARKSP
jgi:hypothetical protein